MALVDYGYYSEKYGGSIAEEDFLKTLRKVEVYLKTVTHGKLTKQNACQYVSLNDCVCEMVDTVYYYSKNFSEGGVKEKKSETTDGYTVSYVTETKDGVDSITIMKSKLYSIVRYWLSDTGLLSGVIKC